MGLHQIRWCDGCAVTHEKRVTAALFLGRTALCHYWRMRLRSVFVTTALLLSLTAAPSSPASADPCPAPPAPAPQGCTPPGPGGNPPMGGAGSPVCPPNTPAGQPCAPAGAAGSMPKPSGFTSKYPLDRSVDIFSAAQPDLGKTMQTEYYGVSFDSSSRLQTTPFIKVENQIGQGLRDENLCTGLDDPSCAATKGWQTIFIEGGIGNCAANPNTACVESFSVTTNDGKEIIAKPLSKFPKDAKEFSGKVNRDGTGYAAGLASWIWRADGDSSGSEHDYLLTGYVQSGGQNMNQSWNDLHVIQFFFEVIPIVRESSSLVKAPEKILQKRVGKNYSEVMSTNYESACLANDTGVCLHRRDFPAKSRLKVTLQLPKFISGWLNGRLNKPTATSAPYSTSYDRIVVDAGPEQNIFAGNWMKKSTLPKLSFKTDAAARMFTGLTNGDNPMSLRDSGEDGALDAYETWAPYMGEKAFAINETWTLSNARVDNPSSCVKKGAGVQGVVATNASAYEATAPTYDKSSGTLNYRVAAPHFAPDGKTENIGTYGLSMSTSLIKCLYGVDQLPSSASISITASDGKERVSTVALQQVGNWVYLSAENFTFSSPTLKIKLNQSAAQSSSAAAGSSGSSSSAMKSAAPAKAAPPKISITCIKGKVTKKVTGSAPKCPAGFKKR